MNKIYLLHAIKITNQYLFKLFIILIYKIINVRPIIRKIDSKKHKIRNKYSCGG